MSTESVVKLNEEDLAYLNKSQKDFDRLVLQFGYEVMKTELNKVQNLETLSKARGILNDRIKTTLERKGVEGADPEEWLLTPQLEGLAKRDFVIGLLRQQRAQQEAAAAAQAQEIPVEIPVETPETEPEADGESVQDSSDAVEEDTSSES